LRQIGLTTRQGLACRRFRENPNHSGAGLTGLPRGFVALARRNTRVLRPSVAGLAAKNGEKMTKGAGRG
jgi:hypothetical protein